MANSSYVCARSLRAETYASNPCTELHRTTPSAPAAVALFLEKPVQSVTFRCTLCDILCQRSSRSVPRAHWSVIQLAGSPFRPHSVCFACAQFCSCCWRQFSVSAPSRPCITMCSALVTRIIVPEHVKHIHEMGDCTEKHGERSPQTDGSGSHYAT